MRYVVLLGLLILGLTAVGCSWGLSPEDKKQEEELTAQVKAMRQALVDKLARRDFLKQALVDPSLLRDITPEQATEELEQTVKDIEALRPVVSKYEQQLADFLKSRTVPWWIKVLTVAEHAALLITGGGSVLAVLRGIALRAVTLAIERKTASSKQEPDGVRATVTKEAGKGLFGPFIAWIVNNFAGKAEKTVKAEE